MTLVKLGKVFFDLIVFLLFAVLIGLWWIPEFIWNAQGGVEGSFLRATVILIIAAVMYYKEVIALKRHHTIIHLYFYTTLALVTIFGYCYGIFFRWQ